MQSETECGINLMLGWGRSLGSRDSEVFRTISFKLGKSLHRTKRIMGARQKVLLAESESGMSKADWGQRGPLWWRGEDELREWLGGKTRMVSWGNTEKDVGRQDNDLEFRLGAEPGATCTEQCLGECNLAIWCQMDCSRACLRLGDSWRLNRSPGTRWRGPS